MSTPRVHEEPEHIAITVNSPQESLATVLRGPTQDRERDLPPRPPPSASDADLLASDTQRVRSSPEPIVSATNTVPASPIQTPNRSAANLLHEERTPRRTATSPSRRVSIPPTVYDPDGFSGRYPTHTFNARPKSALVQSPNPNTSYSGMLAGNLSRRNTMLSEGVAPPPPRPIFPDEKKPVQLFNCRHTGVALNTTDCSLVKKRLASVSSPPSRWPAVNALNLLRKVRLAFLPYTISSQLSRKIP